MVRNRQKRASREQIARLGIPLTVRNYQKVEDSSYGPKPQLTPDSPKQIEMVPVPASENVSDQLTGDVSDTEIQFYVADDDATNIKGVNPSENLATEIDHQGTTFTVQSVNPHEEAGIVILEANTGP